MTAEEMEQIEAFICFRALLIVAERGTDAEIAEILKQTTITAIAAFAALVDDLRAQVADAQRERDDAREQLQRIGRKAFWAAKNASGAVVA
jgi:hypothetical protein